MTFQQRLRVKEKLLSTLEPKNKHITVRLTDDEHKKLTSRAEREYVNKSDLIRRELFD
jgi:hypothetical protein